ncbi:MULTISPECIES: CPBP family intramembrane glutamic endopeptidase [Eikenella]|uniref:CPBP family intramembrane metalloprotease n=1 Tax=Eikenella exigua TaxID=2528037 RepID=A0AAX1F807_9NEIS|nr:MULTISPECIES: CPBP family intramembrane glutamic endopeptidase [Eikenella]QED92165.1 CPBP family intramembrane metalloprotease [Eikenella exigua]
MRLIGLLILMQVLPLLVLLLGGMGKSMAAQAVAALLFTVAAVAMCRLCLQLYRKQADGYFQDWQSRFSGKKLLWAAGYIALMLATNPLYEMLMAALGLESSVDNLQNQRMVMEMLQRAPLTMAAYIVLFAPILEELLLRGIFFQSFGSIENRGKRWLLLVLSAFIFGSLHSPPVHYDFLLYFAMGLVLGAAYLHTKDLKYPVLIHMVNNALGLAGVLFE